MGDNLLVVDLGSDFEVDHVSCAVGYTCVLSTNNHIKCFGGNGQGNLGYGFTENLGVNASKMGDNLQVVDLGVHFVPIQLECGEKHCCAISVNLHLKCWGNNGNGVLGQGNTDNIGDDPYEMGDNLTKIDLGTNFNVSDIQCGWKHSCALSTTQYVKCWGSNEAGKLGLGDTSDRGDVIGEMGDNLHVLDFGDDFVPYLLGGGQHHNLVISTTGTLKAWGWGAQGQLGYENTLWMGNRGSHRRWQWLYC